MGRGRARTQRRHFAQSRENVWKRPKSDPSSDEPNNNTTTTTDGADTNDNPTWQPFANQNPAFEEYYKEQGIVNAEEWDTFIEFLRKPLPAAFRINSSSQFCEDIRSQLENDFMKTLQAEFTGIDEVDAIRPLPWYPENLAWHSNFSRMQLRKNQTLERFHEFLKLENEIGNITRQEAVSMVPPLFLDVHPDHFVLDMCAAPGSKTFQLLEIIHSSTEAGSLPNGMVVANDLDVQRCNLLIHQTKRMCTANLIVTNHEAQQFPGCRLSKGHVSTSEADNQVEANLSQLVFDRVLCDVPCSGDGTLRKAPDIWRKWNAGMGNGLHGLQIHIAMRGASLLKVGGRMVYSTCSMNPIENEAVVAEVLRRCGGSLELIDVSSELSQLIRRPGLKKWRVRDKGTWLASYKDVPKLRRHGVIPSMFPLGRTFKDLASETEELQNGHVTNAEDGNQRSDTPLIPDADVEKEYSDFPLESCLRIVPHDQNGGAFFIAVFQKVAPLPAVVLDKPSSLHKKSSSEGDGPIEKGSNELTEGLNELENDLADDKEEKLSEATLGAESVNVPENAALEPDPSSAGEEQNSNEIKEPANGKTGQLGDGRVGKRKLQIQGKWRGVDPVVFFKDETVIGSIKSFYGIVESFPLDGHLITRNSDTKHVKRIYYISKSVKEVLELNFKVGQQLKITSIGLKMFERQSSREGTAAPCSFRISSEGLPLILPYITKQILYAPLVDFKHLLQYKSVKFADFVDADLGDKASKLQPGCCVVVLRNGNDSLNQNLMEKSTIAIGCWRGKASISVMVTATDCKELLERLLERVDTGKNASDGESMHLNGTDEVMKAMEPIENVEHVIPEIEK